MLLLEDKLSYLFNGCLLSENDELFVDDSDDICEKLMEEIEENENELFDIFNGYQVRCGASKAVVIPHDYGYVIKIPFNGSGEYDYDEDDDDADEELIFNDFTGALIGNGWDYCLAETLVYEIAKEEGFDKYFAKTSYWKDTERGYPLYIQEKVETYSERSPSKKSLDSIEKIQGEFDKNHLHIPIYDDDWSGIFIDFYGEAAYESFMKFLAKEDINDLHSGNLGYRLADGAPVIFDYSGYRG